MRALHALMMLFGALAVLMTGAVPASAWADTSSTPPCHETAMAHGGAETPSPASDTAMTGLDCCVACVAAPALPIPDRARLRSPQPAPAAPAVTLLCGEQPAPEPHPPRADLL
ncbi:hypothetical protein [Brevundimonas sp.]|uniref:hypothetical protein n=1 Tax=Brevundimonas sp. TaxID=1871086 RepID=UPI002D3DDAAB|nr:hypothetical protein [Brevundimonas sp.]HYC68023.1 hypothetical protein [Brevundimonas sp.]